MTDEQAYKEYSGRPLDHEDGFSEDECALHHAYFAGIKHARTIPPELVALSKEATPGDWFWDHGSTIRTEHNANSEYSRFYQYVLWPQNVPGGEDLTSAQQMGACGTDTEPQSEANQKLLVAAVNYVRQLIKEQK